MTEIIYKKASYAIIGTCLEVCFGKIVLELKTVSALADEHRAQVLNYLHAPASTWGCWQILDITRSWNTSALQKLEAQTQEAIFQMSLCNYSRLFGVFAG